MYIYIYTRHNLWILIVASIIRSYNSVIWNLYVKFTYRPGFNPPHGFPQVLKKHWTIHGLIKVRLLEKLCPCFEPSPDGVASRWFQGQSWNFCCEDFFWVPGKPGLPSNDGPQGGTILPLSWSVRRVAFSTVQLGFVWHDCKARCVEIRVAPLMRLSQRHQ